MEILSQRDKRWGNILLGWGDVPIKDVGCLISCLAMLWDTTPDVVNEWLKNNSGYVNLNLIDWTKIPGFEWRGWTYDNNRVAETISKYGGCIVETDFNTNPKDGSHFVVFIGDKKLYDPWDGKEKKTSSFPVFYGYAIIDPSKSPIKGEIMTDCLLYNNEKDQKIYSGLVGDSSKYSEFAKKGYSTVADVNELRAGLNKSIDDKSKEIATLKTTAEEYRKTLNAFVSDIALALACRQDTIEILTFAKEAGEKAGELEDLQTAFASLKNNSETAHSELNAEIARLKALLAQKDVLSNAKLEDLLKEIVKRLLVILRAK